MLLQSIAAWLITPDDYEAGLDLLRATGYAGFTLTILAKGADAYNRARLETELQKWSDRRTVDSPNNVLPIGAAAAMVKEYNSVVTPSTPELVLPKIPASTVVQPDQIPKKPTIESESSVLELKERSYRLMDERAELKARLRAKADDGNDDELMAERLPWACRIKTITREIDEVYSQLDFHEQYGYLPPVAADPAVDVDDTAALMNVRSYVSRYKAKLKKKNLTPEQRGSFEKLLSSYEEEKQRLELKLKRTNDSHSTGQQTTDCPNHSPVLSRT